MTADDLTTPLGQGKARRPRRRLPFGVQKIIATLLVLFLAVFAGFAIFGDNPFGGEPVVRIALNAPVAPDKSAKPAAETKSPAAAEPATAKAATSSPEHKTVTIIDGSSGARHDISVPIAAPEASADASATPTIMAGINPRLLESARYGMIPVIADGLKPSRVYAGGNDADRAKAAGMPAVAIVIGGLGVGAAKTNDAIVKLPAAVTLAFTPYGADPGKLVERARSQGHEILLQVPMEPFEYPDNDPGPQTLLTSLPADQNLDRLTWHLSRFQGYVGLTNFMGARFVATEAALQPVIRDAAKRGLVYLDDGSAARSVAGPLAESQSLPFAKADATIDTVPTPVEIDRALTQLEATARQRGFAIGMASALPISIERISNWAKALQSRSILLVPLTTAMLKSKSS